MMSPPNMTRDSSPAPDRPHLDTGDPNFRFLFGGYDGLGITTGAESQGGTSILIEGLSGTGKTILSCQLTTHSLRQNWRRNGLSAGS